MYFFFSEVSDLINMSEDTEKLYSKPGMEKHEVMVFRRKGFSFQVIIENVKCKY